MWKTVAVAGTAAALIGGAGTAAFAASGTDTPTPSPSSVSSPAQASANGSTTRAQSPRSLQRLRGTVHMTWVRENKKTKTFTTHNAIRGQVTAVSATSITIKAADNVTETFVLDSGSKVRSRTKKTAVSISEVKAGDRVLVVGTGTTTLTASRVVELK